VRRRIREALRDIGEGGRRASDALKEELERMTLDQTELKARLAALEAKVAPEKKKKAGHTKEAKKAKKRR
jgi:hypothetical protein